MFDELIIKALPGLVKFFEKLEMDFYFTPTQVRHFRAFVVAMMLKGFNGKMNDVSDLSLTTHRTTCGRFLSSTAWDEKFLLRVMNKHVYEVIWQEAKLTGLPIYVIIDDTICGKTKPSSKVKQPIYGCGFHRSHLKDDFVWGHQFVTCMLRCGDMVLPLDIVLYDKSVDKSEIKSKIDIAKEIIASLPRPPHKSYVLTDSWYSCKGLFEAAKARGYHFIGALKSNRLIFPRGFRKKGVQIGMYARSLKPSDCNFVTVGGHRYHVYTYLGRINGLKKVKIVITWPQGAFGIPHAMRAYISTDIELNPRQLLAHYMKRWPIEVFFREANRCLGMKKCQTRSKKAVIRYQYILMLGYIFCGLEVLGDNISLGKQQLRYQKAIEAFRITWAYEQGQKNADLSQVLLEFRVPHDRCA